MHLLRIDWEPDLVEGGTEPFTVLATLLIFRLAGDPGIAAEIIRSIGHGASRVSCDGVFHKSSSCSACCVVFTAWLYGS